MLINIVSAMPASEQTHDPCSNPNVLARRTSDISLPDGSVQPEQV